MKRKKNRKHFLITIKSIVKMVLPVTVSVILCWVLLYANSYVDSSNTYTVECIVESIYYDSPYKGRSKGVITTTEGEVYEIYSIFLDEDEVDKLLQSNKKVSLVVWNYSFVLGPPIKTIVDMRSDDTIYHTIDDQNEYSKNQRTGYWFTLIPFFSFFGISLSCLFFYIEFFEKIRRYIKRMKKKRKKRLRSKHKNNNDSM